MRVTRKSSISRCTSQRRMALWYSASLVTFFLSSLNISSRAELSRRQRTVFSSEKGYMARAIICISARSTCSRLQPFELRNSLIFKTFDVERKMASEPIVRASFCTMLLMLMVTRSRLRSASLRSAFGRFAQQRTWLRSWLLFPCPWLCAHALPASPL